MSEPRLVGSFDLVTQDGRRLTAQRWECSTPPRVVERPGLLADLKVCGLTTRSTFIVGHNHYIVIESRTAQWDGWLRDPVSNACIMFRYAEPEAPL